MRKYVVGFIAGAVLMMSAQAFGANISLIGKKIDGQATVKTTSGQTIGTAIVVEGKSYAPVRDVTEAFGGKVKSASNGVIVLDSHVSNQDESPGTNVSDNSDQIRTQINQLDAQIGELNTKIQNAKNIISNKSSSESSINALQGTIDLYTKQSEIETDANIKKGLQDNIKYYQEKIESIKKNISDAETNLPIWESQLADLQKQKADLEAELQK